MIDLLFACGYNFFCHFDYYKAELRSQKYPPDVAQLCFYFEEQKTDLPDYCKWKTEVKPPRRRSDF